MDILQGSVATCLRCDEIFDDNFIANLLLSMPTKALFATGQCLVKKMDRSLAAPFLTHGVVLKQLM